MTATTTAPTALAAPAPVAAAPTPAPAPRRSHAVPGVRRGTLAFLGHARGVAHVHLITEVDARALVAARHAGGDTVAYTAFVVKAAGDVLARHPEAGAMLTGRLRPRLHHVAGVHAKVLFDKSVDGQRCVVSGTVRDVDTRPLSEVSDDIVAFRDAEVGPDGPFAATRRLARVPLPLLTLLYRAGLHRPQLRAALQGTFSVTSVGHTPVRTILPMISGTVGLGVGRVTDRAVVLDGAVVAAPVLPLSLTFDHRVVDGALAADLLTAIAHTLETQESS